MTFSMYYAFSENFILPISHDEVVHGKRSLLDKMPGSYDDKFSNLRAYIGYMMSHPGKKLTFMGTEFGQFKEWAYKEGLEFFLLEYEKHRQLQRFFREINEFYKQTPAFYEIEDSWEGFSWILADERDKNVFAYKRFDKRGKAVYVIINMSGCDYAEFPLKAEKGKYKLVFDSDALKYGGRGVNKKRVAEAKRLDKKDVNAYMKLTLPKLSCQYYEEKEQK